MTTLLFAVLMFLVVQVLMSPLEKQVERIHEENGRLFFDIQRPEFIRLSLTTWLQRRWGRWDDITMIAGVCGLAGLLYYEHFFAAATLLSTIPVFITLARYTRELHARTELRALTRTTRMEQTI